ncbi:MAG: 3-dehydroquinate dehydratase, type I, 3-dehydroquinate dehydratase I [Candidatus Peregrinibacteria bacterium GW2011_GWF2_33_10]|nr:MAG: 3-dehydroquinate dehydratase, type I, 3-dehydroquinate dehydratase I [Candidatus Peregrinibacteria bacterium GW2011_GWF2_33_10]OGJ44825.1 MAG: hypothetical protein A2263_06330 [Candidatus Peregrinibacteria bacterium RIFOXYA2_FULL_33_21]OGJ47111.1 MAG: hypothetical protein A2272_03050 [Candidatus Peregrinibacteria bacterium RIFOXYA12_FULL_33_12]OGJ50511.1 MAG: hypothetical protein A2307_02955 [Candidatus Peregrinibacteria bacterium RIFOXYB2_FULL_33_20]
MKICIPIKVKNMRTALEKLAEAEQKADMTEIWLDQIENLNLEEIFKHRTKPILAVCKNPEEMGSFQGDNFDKINLFTKFIELGGEYVDISDLHNIDFLKTYKNSCSFQIIYSFHDFIKTPTFMNLSNIIDQAVNTEIDMIKIATRVKDAYDIQTLEKCVAKILEVNKKPIVLGMDHLGKRTRLGKGLFQNNYLTFAALSEEEKTASGQITINEIIDFKL